MMDPFASAIERMMDADLDVVLDLMMAELFIEIAPGVDGLVRDTDKEIEIVGLRAHAEGSGAVGHFLDGLPRDRQVAVPLVTSERLAGMLRRRGFVEVDRFDHRFGLTGWGKVWLRRVR